MQQRPLPLQKCAQIAGGCPRDGRWGEAFRERTWLEQLLVCTGFGCVRLAHEHHSIGETDAAGEWIEVAGLHEGEAVLAETLGPVGRGLPLMGEVVDREEAFAEIFPDAQ